MSLRLHSLATLLSVAAALAACGGDADDGSDGGTDDVVIADGPLAGVVGGQPWVVATGETDPFLSEGGDLFAILSPDAYTPCEALPPPADRLILSVPTQPGTYELGLSQNITFAVDNENLVATEGLLRVDEVTATTARGGLHAIFDADNEVSGTFELTICPE